MTILIYGTSLANFKFYRIVFIDSVCVASLAAILDHSNVYDEVWMPNAKNA